MASRASPPPPPPPPSPVAEDAPPSSPADLAGWLQKRLTNRALAARAPVPTLEGQKAEPAPLALALVHVDTATVGGDVRRIAQDAGEEVVAPKLSASIRAVYNATLVGSGTPFSVNMALSLDGGGVNLVVPIDRSAGGSCALSGNATVALAPGPPSGDARVDAAAAFVADAVAAHETMEASLLDAAERGICEVLLRAFGTHAADSGLLSVEKKMEKMSHERWLAIAASALALLCVLFLCCQGCSQGGSRREPEFMPLKAPEVDPDVRGRGGFLSSFNCCRRDE
mmetsp:Transcript_118761/g.332607  ORF Transcript_118761/g.332607 Transcript_118761/m.332607 type:complete len:283 (-) Transcript_118761:60-908(-)